MTGNIGGNVIRKLMKFEGVYHCMVQDKQGVIHHAKFNTETQAKEYMNLFHDTKVKVEYIR